jgi:hypothetical protein
MNITINTPALLFPAISLIMLAYTNRFLSVASLIRTLVNEYRTNENNILLDEQIDYLKIRLNLIKNMQVCGVASFLFAVFSMYLIYIDQMDYANILFALSVITLSVSLILSLVEIYRSTKALEVAMGSCKSKKNKQEEIKSLNE